MVSWSCSSQLTWSAFWLHWEINFKLTYFNIFLTTELVYNHLDFFFTDLKNKNWNNTCVFDKSVVKMKCKIPDRTTTDSVVHWFTAFRDIVWVLLPPVSLLPRPQRGESGQFYNHISSHAHHCPTLMWPDGWKRQVMEWVGGGSGQEAGDAALSCSQSLDSKRERVFESTPRLLAVISAQFKLKRH